MGQLEFCQRTVAFVRLRLLLCGLSEVAVRSSGGQEWGFPVFPAHAPPIGLPVYEGYAIPVRFYVYKARVPCYGIVRIVQCLVVVPTLSELCGAAYAVVGRYDAKLDNVQLGADVVPPDRSPSGDSRAKF